MLDSLVRVSRRVNENHFVSISNFASSSTGHQTVSRSAARTALAVRADRTTEHPGANLAGEFQPLALEQRFLSPDRGRRLPGYNNPTHDRPNPPSRQLSPTDSELMLTGAKDVTETTRAGVEPSTEAEAENSSRPSSPPPPRIASITPRHLYYWLPSLPS